MMSIATVEVYIDALLLTDDLEEQEVPGKAKQGLFLVRNQMNTGISPTVLTVLRRIIKQGELLELEDPIDELTLAREYLERNQRPLQVAIYRILPGTLFGLIPLLGNANPENELEALLPNSHFSLPQGVSEAALYGLLQEMYDPYYTIRSLLHME